jgi:hypothetical protein
MFAACSSGVFIMHISKILTTTVAAAAMAGALTMAYAQSTTPTETPAAPAMQNQPAMPVTPDTSTQTPSAAPATSPMPAETTQFQGERPAQADRN